MTRKEKAQAIRTALKAKGWNARHVSVRCSRGSAIYVTIRNAAVPRDEVTVIAKDHESIDRCPITHDILSGGNTFIFVEYESSLLRARADELEANLSDEPGVSVSVEGFDVWRVSDHTRGGSDYYCISQTGGDLNTNIQCWGKHTAAERLAVVLWNGGFDAYGEWIAPGKAA